jgi:hypothetical protein
MATSINDPVNAQAVWDQLTPPDGIPHNDLHQGIRAQLDLADTALQPGPLPAGTTLPAEQISDATLAGRAVLTAASASAQRTAMGAMAATLAGWQAAFDAAPAGEKAVAQASVSRDWNNGLLLISDSIGDQVTDVTATVAQYAAYGHVSWALLRTNWGFYFDNGDNLAVSGSTLDGVSGTPDARTQVAAAISRSESNVLVIIGTNSLTQATTADEMFALWPDSYILPLLAAAKRVFACPVFPRDGLSVANRLKRARYNRMIVQWGQQTSASGAPLVMIPAGNKWEDVASATPGNTASGILYDGTHPTPLGAYYAGWEDIGGALERYFPGRYVPFSPADTYDATNNPSGSIFINSHLAGTAGNKPTSGGITATGEVANACRLYRGVGTSTATLVGSKAAPLDPGYSGAWQRMQVSITGAGAATETYIFSPDAAITLPTGFAAGDTVQLEVPVWVASHTGLIGLEAQLVEVGPGAPRQGLAMVRQSGYSMPFPTGRIVVLRTHPFALQSGVTALSGYVRAVLTGAAGNGIDMYVIGYVPRKIV